MPSPKFPISIENSLEMYMLHLTKLAGFVPMGSMLPVSAALRVPSCSTTGAVLRRREAERRHQLSAGPRTYVSGPCRYQYTVNQIHQWSPELHVYKMATWS